MDTDLLVMLVTLAMDTLPTLVFITESMLMVMDTLALDTTERGPLMLNPRPMLTMVTSVMADPTPTAMVLDTEDMVTVDTMATTTDKNPMQKNVTQTKAQSNFFSP